VGSDLTAGTQALVQSTLLGELLENAKIGALAADRGVYVSANEYASELLGYERSELIGTRVGELHPLSELPQHFAEIERGEREGGQLLITRKDGEQIRIQYRAVNTTLAGLPLILGLFWPA
jgi:PAS domain S-box-containing protein